MSEECYCPQCWALKCPRYDAMSDYQECGCEYGLCSECDAEYWAAVWAEKAREDAAEEKRKSERVARVIMKKKGVE